jgi:glycosyltransferase involved in cell wall biosynthesis
VRITFVIPAHNEELLIGRTVAACVEAGRALGELFEVVVACDACTDRTAEIAVAGGARVVEINKRIIAGVRNAGARAAIEAMEEHRPLKAAVGGTGGTDMLIFVDADTSPPPASVREAVDLVKAGAIGGGGSVTFDGPIPFYARPLMWLFNVIFRFLRLTGGCFLFCTRAGYEAVGGFDEALLAGEEITMANMLKKHGRFEIVRTPVITSGRKLRTYSGWEITKLIFIGLLRPSMRRDRKKLDLWYGPRREDPFAGAGGDASKQ